MVSALHKPRAQARERRARFWLLRWVVCLWRCLLTPSHMHRTDGSTVGQNLGVRKRRRGRNLFLEHTRATVAIFFLQEGRNSPQTPSETLVCACWPSHQPRGRELVCHRHPLLKGAQCLGEWGPRGVAGVLDSAGRPPRDRRTKFKSNDWTASVAAPFICD